MRKYQLILLVIIGLLTFHACEKLETENNNNPDRSSVLTSGADLVSVLRGGYVAWWQGINSEQSVVGISVAADIFSLGRNNFAAQRMGNEPRQVYNNTESEATEYKEVVETPWFGCLSAVSSANDILTALENGVTIDNGGAQDQSIRAAALMLRGLSWGYLGLLFERGLIVDENTNFQNKLEFSTYQETIEKAVTELEQAIEIADLVDIDFVHEYFNGVVLNEDQFVRLCHSFAARFLAQWPRTSEEYAQVDWNLVNSHSEQGIQLDFAPIADGNFWQSYHKFTFAETGQGPFWARIDQRLIAAMDPSQPPRYPLVVTNGEDPLNPTMATSNDQRLTSDFIFLPTNNFQVENGEWHFSHYKHNRNITEPSFAGNGSTSGPMPTFLVSDNQLLQAEALLNLGQSNQAIQIINNSSRINRGNLAPLTNPSAEAIASAIFYERAIELINAGPMGYWFDRRRRSERVTAESLDALGGLQAGTPAHLPVPAVELNIQGLELYNIGGPEGPLGITPIF